jgi:hypothetical protein
MLPSFSVIALLRCRYPLLTLLTSLLTSHFARLGISHAPAFMTPISGVPATGNQAAPCGHHS